MNNGIMNYTNENIEWAKWSWNPVTGCKHDCQYCYAHDIAMRFSGTFEPQFHENRLSMPANTKIPCCKQNEPGIKNVFVCSMADLFGDWVPQEWIDKVLKVCGQNKQWTYLFLTKNPKRYIEFENIIPDNAWIGASADNQDRLDKAIEAFAKFQKKPNVLFLSCEPLEENLTLPDYKFVDWVIIGGRSKTSRMPANQPKSEWVQNIVDWAKLHTAKIYFKPNLEAIPDKNFVPKEYPNLDIKANSHSHNKTYDNIPLELKEKKQWVLWKLETRQEKQIKMPYQITGKPAKANDSETWYNYDSVLEVLEKGKYNGIGFMFDSDFIGIDIDNCIDEKGNISEIANHYISEFSSYTEYSQSKKGIHIILKNTGIPGNAKQKKPFEIYNAGRFFALTGDLVKQGLREIKENDLLVKEFYCNCIGEPENKAEKKSLREYVKLENNDGFVSAVLEVLEQSSNICDCFDSWKRLALSLKSANIPFEIADRIFASSIGYNEKENKHLYERMKPNRISFGTAYHVAKQANETLLKEKLKAIKKSNLVISPNIPNDNQAKDSIFEQGNKTYIVKCKKGNGLDGDSYFEIPVANFTMAIEKKIVDDKDHVSYLATFQSDTEKETIEINGNTLGNITQFRDAIMIKGAFLYDIVDTPTHNKFISFVLSKGIPTKARKTMYLGANKEGFLTHNALVKKDGSIVPIENANIIPPKPENAAKKMIISYDKIDIKEFLNHLQNICGNQTWKIIGFIVATLFRDKIFEQLNGFPVLFFYGKHQTGKNTIAQIIQACLSCHRAIGSIPSGTFKAWKRLAAKFCNCAMILNEFQSNESNNIQICGLFDGEGYVRAKKDDTLDTVNFPISATTIIISTLAITGSKAEDAQSRIIEVDSDQFLKNIDSFNWFKRNIDKLSSILPQIFSLIDDDCLLDNIINQTDQARNNITCETIEDRILKNHVMIATCYNKLMQNAKIDTQANTNEILAQSIQQTQTTKQSDLAQIFLSVLTSMIRNDDISDNIALIEKQDDKEILIFRLKEALPLVRRMGKQSQIEIADEKTIYRSLLLLPNTESKATRKFGANPIKAIHTELLQTF